MFIRVRPTQVINVNKVTQVLRLPIETPHSLGYSLDDDGKFRDFDGDLFDQKNHPELACLVPDMEEGYRIDYTVSQGEYHCSTKTIYFDDISVLGEYLLIFDTETGIIMRLATEEDTKLIEALGL